jgi:hypothetical protein
MKKSIITMIMLAITTIAFPQFNREQAIELVLNSILESDTGKINIYCAYESLTENQIILMDDGDSVLCPYEDN